MYNSLLLFIPQYLRSMQKSWHRVYLSLGSNEGNSHQNLSTAIAFISKEIGSVRKISPIYKTAAWGLTNQNDFLNICIEISTPFPPLLTMKKIIAIEMKMGRVRTQKWGPRIIDIDIVFFDQLILNHADLQLPHPHFQNRKFVLQPLSDIASKKIDPVSNKTVSNLAKQCSDTSKITPYFS